MLNKIESHMRTEVKMARNEPMTEKPKSTKWVADKLGYTPQTVMRMAREGELPAFRLTPRGAWKFHEKEILQRIQTQSH